MKYIFIILFFYNSAFSTWLVGDGDPYGYDNIEDCEAEAKIFAYNTFVEICDSPYGGLDNCPWLANPLLNMEASVVAACSGDNPDTGEPLYPEEPEEPEVIPFEYFCHDSLTNIHNKTSYEYINLNNVSKDYGYFSSFINDFNNETLPIDSVMSYKSNYYDYYWSYQNRAVLYGHSSFTNALKNSGFSNYDSPDSDGTRYLNITRKDIGFNNLILFYNNELQQIKVFISSTAYVFNVYATLYGSGGGEIGTYEDGSNKDNCSRGHISFNGSYGSYGFICSREPSVDLFTNSEENYNWSVKTFIIDRSAPCATNKNLGLLGYAKMRNLLYGVKK